MDVFIARNVPSTFIDTDPDGQKFGTSTTPNNDWFESRKRQQHAKEFSDPFNCNGDEECSDGDLPHPEPYSSHGDKPPQADPFQPHSDLYPPNPDPCPDCCKQSTLPSYEAVLEVQRIIVDVDNDEDVVQPIHTNGSGSVVDESREEYEDVFDEDIDLSLRQKREAKVRKYKKRLREDAKMAMDTERSAAEIWKPGKVSEVAPILGSTFCLDGNVSGFIVRTPPLSLLRTVSRFIKPRSSWI